MRESEFLKIIRDLSRGDPQVSIPIGDDLGAIRFDDLLLAGIDQVLENVHFDLRIHSPAQAGRKAVLRNLSDCAAMACRPVAILASLALPRAASPEAALAIFRAMRDCASQHGAILLGGDTGSWTGPLAISVAVIAKSDGVEPVRRSGAKPGDKLYVTGPLGGSIRGRHIDFTPRISLARELAQAYELHAMMDLSDGLSRDLPRLCEASGVGATLLAHKIPIHSDASTLEHALHDGEDYELLFASPSCDDPRVTCVGTIDPHPGVRLQTSSDLLSLEPNGWDHELGSAS